MHWTQNFEFLTACVLPADIEMVGATVQRICIIRLQRRIILGGNGQ
jgi:hypothetical protein